VISERRHGVPAPANGAVEHPQPSESLFHLISAHEVVPSNWHLHPTYTALCGARVESGSLEGTDCPNECQCEDARTLVSCPDCLRAAIGQNRRAGIDAGDGSMAPRALNPRPAAG
jgi:hypothetical protein